MDISNLWVTVGANIDNLMSGLNTASQATDTASTNMTASIDGVKAAWVAAAAGVGVLLGAITNFSSEVHKTQNQLQASLGLTAEEAQRLGNITKNVFANNFGESITEIGTSLQEVRSQLKGLSDNELQAATENAYRLKDVFGTEVGESVNAVSTLMREFGMSQQEAFDFITKGMQSGLNASGDFLDTIGEYSNQFAGAKLTSGEFFSTLETGLKGGALGTDKIADAIKEFGIRIVDGSKSSTDALDALGISWTKLSAEIGSGKMSKSDALKLVQDRLKNVKDEVKQNTIGVGLFGTQWEDLGAKAVLSVNLQQTSLKDLEGSTSKLDVKYNDLGTALTGLGRRITVAFTPIGDAITSLINQAMPFIVSVTNGIASVGEAFNKLPEPIKNTVTALAILAGAVSAGVAIYATVAPMLATMGISFTSVGATATAFAATVRTASASVVTSISAAIWPITLVVAAIGGLYLAYRNNFLGIRDFLKPIVDNIVAVIGKIVDGIKYVVYNAGPLWKGFTEAFKLTVATVGDIVRGMGTILSGVGLILYAAFIEPFVPVFNALNTAANAIVSGLAVLVNRIASVLKPVFDLLARMGIGIGDALKNAMSTVSSFVGNLFSGAASQMKSQADEAAKANSTFAKGLDKVKSGWNDVTSSVSKYKQELSTIKTDTVANLKPVPQTAVPNAKLPNTPASTGIPTPANSGATRPVSSSVDGTSSGSTQTGKGAATGPYKATAEDVRSVSTALQRLVEDEKKAVASGKLTEEQAIAYKRKVEDLWVQIDKLNLETNKSVTNLYSQAKAYVQVSMNAAKANEERQRQSEARKKADEELAKQLDWLGKSIKDMSDADIAFNIKKLESSKAYGYQKKLEILNSEANARAIAKEEEAFNNLQAKLESYQEAASKVAGVTQSLQDEATSFAESTASIDLNNRMEAELAAVADNEAAKLDIKKKYAPQLLKLEEDRINAESNAKAAKLGEDYFAALAIASEEGIDTTALTATYIAARQALNANADARIASNRIKSESDIAKDTLAIEQKIADERVRINSDAAQTIVDNYTDNLSDLSTAVMTDIKGELDKLRAFYAAMGEDGASSVAIVDAAIGKVDKAIGGSVAKAVDGMANIAGQLNDLDSDYNKLLSPDSRDTFISSGLSGFDTLITKYDDLIEAATEYADTFDGAGDTPAAKAARDEAARLTTIRDGIQTSRSNKRVELGTQFDSDKAKAAKAIDDSITASQLANAGEVADFKLRKLQIEKAAKLSLATTDAQRAQVELAYVDKIKDAQLEAIEIKQQAAMKSLQLERQEAVSKKGLTQKQIDDTNALYDAKDKTVKDSYDFEKQQIKETADASEEAQKKNLLSWKKLLQDFVKEMASAVSGAYKSIYETNAKLMSGSYASPEEYAKAQQDAAKANGEAAKNAGIGIFNAAVTGLKAVFPEFAYLIDIVGGLLGNMPQLGLVFQRVGEIFLVVMEALAPVVEMLATILEPLLNIFKVVLQTIIQPLIPVLTFFMQITATILSAIYGMIKTVWNTVASFLNGINIAGWRPFNLSMMPDLGGTSTNMPSVGNASGNVGGTGGSSGNSGSTSNISLTFYVNEASNADEVARLVEKRIIKALS